MITEEQLPQKSLAELTENERVTVRATIVQAFEPRFFLACPQCGKKPAMEGEKYNCQEHGQIMPQDRALLSLVLDDGKATIRAICFTDIIKKIFNIELEGIKDLIKRADKSELLGKEMLFLGTVRKNKVFDNMEFMIRDVQEIDPEQLIRELEKKQ